MKPLPPTLRGKKRYIAFKIFINGRISKKEVIDAILDEGLRFFGELKMSDFGLWVVECDMDKGVGFLVCNHRHKGEVIACLSLIDSVSHKKASFQVLGVSGTIKSLKRKFLNDGSNMSEMKGENNYATDTKHGI
jgi:ribonuclease P/MRP protein subunit POP5